MCAAGLASPDVSRRATLFSRQALASKAAESDLRFTVGTLPMDGSDRIGFEDCPTCGRAATFGWIEADLSEINCLDGCHLARRPASQRPTFGASRDRDAIAGVEVLDA